MNEECQHRRWIVSDVRTFAPEPKEKIGNNSVAWWEHSTLICKDCGFSKPNRVAVLSLLDNLDNFSERAPAERTRVL